MNNTSNSNPVNTSNYQPTTRQREAALECIATLPPEHWISIEDDRGCYGIFRCESFVDDPKTLWIGSSGHPFGAFLREGAGPDDRVLLTTYNGDIHDGFLFNGSGEFRFVASWSSKQISKRGAFQSFNSAEAE